MNDLPIPHRACWSREGAEYVLQTEALTNTGATFLATHTPIEGFTVEGSRSASVAERTEEGLLDALSNEEVRHAFAVVQGEPGSGKSHLIRWLAEVWPRGRDIPVLLRRAEASLEGSLRGLRNAIPPQYKEIVGTIEPKQVKALKGRIADFTSNLGNSLDPGYYEKAQADKTFCEEFLPGDILRNDDVRLNWKAPARIVNLLSGNGASGSPNNRNSESASFDVKDIADLAAYALKVAKTSGRGGKLLGRIGGEVDAIEVALRDGVSPEAFFTTHRSKAPFAARLTEALNSRRNQAIQNSLGISSTKLKEIFQDLRRALKQDGKRLVILLEDITAWEGVDDGLIDVLIDDARTAGGSLCDQISVVGVTPYYFRNLKENYQQRVTLNIGLGDGQGQLQDAANLREPRMRSRFVATYLRAIRVGADQIEGWRDRKVNDASAALQNTCDLCPLDARKRCHEAFGEFDGIGLYPFSERSIENFYAALKRQVGMTWRTPRGVIQGMLVPTMTRPQSLADGAYPIREIEAHEGIEQDASSLFGAARTRLDASLPDPVDRNRARRLIAFWGVRGDNETLPLGDGDLSYASVPKTIFDSFGVPWIGGEIVPEESRGDDDRHDPPVVHPDTDGDATVVAEPAATRDDAYGEGAGRPATRTPVPKETQTGKSKPVVDPKPKPAERPRPLPQKEVIAFQLEVEAVLRGEAFKNPNTWNLFARELLFRLDPRRTGVDEAQFKTLFKEDLVKVKGTVKVDRSTYFEIPTEKWLLDGLAAYAELRHNEHFGGLPAKDQDVVRRQVARCLRRLEDLARRHVERWSAPLLDGTSWSRIATATEVLLVRAWLRGDVRPTADTHEQWRAVLKGDNAIWTEPRSRVESWDAILRKTNESHSAMRAHLVESVRLAQGRGESHGLSDAAIPIASIERLKKLFSPSDRPKASTAIPPDAIQTRIWEAGEATADKLTRLPYDEYERIKRRLMNIDRLLRSKGVADHIKRVEAVVKSAEEDLPPASRQTSVTAWLKLKDAMTKREDADDRMRKVENALMTIIDGDRPDKRLLVLDLVVGQPAAAIEEVDNVLGEAEKMMGIVKTAVADFVGTIHAGALSIEDVRAKGERIAALVGDALEAWSVDA